MNSLSLASGLCRWRLSLIGVLVLRFSLVAYLARLASQQSRVNVGPHAALHNRNVSQYLFELPVMRNRQENVTRLDRLFFLLLDHISGELQ